MYGNFRGLHPLKPSERAKRAARHSPLGRADALWTSAATWLRRALALSTASGVLIAVLYFVRIRYVPVDSFSSIAALGGAVALLAGSLFVSFLFFWAIPTLVVAVARSSESWPELADWFAVKADAHALGRSPKCHPRRVALFVSITLGLGWLAPLVGFVLIGLGCSRLTAWLTGGGMIVGGFALLYPYLAHQTAQGIEASCRWEGFAKRLGWGLLLCVSCAYPLLVTLKVLLLSSWAQDDLMAYLICLGVGVVVVVLHGVNLWMTLEGESPRERPMWAVQAALLLGSMIFMIVSLAGVSQFIDGAMKAVSVRMPSAHVVLGKEACSALRLTGVAVSTFPDASGATHDQACVLLSVTVLSRLGERWRIACRLPEAFDEDRRGFNIDSTQVQAVVDASVVRGEADKSRDVCAATPAV